MPSFDLSNSKLTIETALAETRHRFSKSHNGDLMIAEFQLKYLSKSLAGKRRNNEKLNRIKLESLAQLYSIEDSSYAKLLTESQAVADKLLEINKKS